MSTPPAVPDEAADPREPLGRLVHDIRLAHEADQAAAEGRARFRLASWEEGAPSQRELDMRIGSAVAAEALRQYEAEREALTLARLSRSVKLARIAALCRKSRCSDEGCEGHLIAAADILAIIGGDGKPATEEPAP